jgi:hypothetical protein
MTLSSRSLPGRGVTGLTALVLLLLLLVMDARQSVPINPHRAPAPIALGSGQAPEGAHCTQQ